MKRKSLSTLLCTVLTVHMAERSFVRSGVFDCRRLGQKLEHCGKKENGQK